jgi:hypothetical protein
MNPQVEDFEKRFYLSERDNLDKKIYLTCPVRKATKKDKIFLAKYINELEKQKTGIYYPKWDTNQNDDSIGDKICSRNKKGIYNSQEIHKYLSGASEGSMFDDGMTFMDNKPIKIINKEELENSNEYVKSFINGYCFNNKDDKYKKMLERKQEIKESSFIEYQYGGRTPEFLFDFGMSFMANKPIKLLNKIIPTPKKSFENLLLELNKRNNK